MHACAHFFWPNHFSISYLIHNNLKYLNLNLLETKTFLSNHNILIPCGRFHFIILLSNIQSIHLPVAFIYLLTLVAGTPAFSGFSQDHTLHLFLDTVTEPFCFVLFFLSLMFLKSSDQQFCNTVLF